MKETNKNLESILRSAVMESLRNYELTNDGNLLSDLYLYYDADNQTLRFFDDMEVELLSVNLNDAAEIWGEDISQEINNVAKFVLRELKDEQAFDRDFICKPFSISSIDSDFALESRLIFVDDHTIKSGNDLWASVNKDLDAFLKDLMK
jgi:hypothetical protein